MDRRVDDKVLEPSNASLLKKLIENADNDSEAVQIAALGTTYKRTGLHFDKRLEKDTQTIHYFKKNETLSFKDDKSDITHKLIIGDNYYALLNLLIQYRNSIDVIYIDPPYGKDSMGEFAKTNYENAITRDNLLSMLYTRLVLAKQLLSPSGVIFCSIDDKNQAYVKCLFDEVFNESNFIGMFMWFKSETPPNLSKKIKKNLEYIICYQKKKDNSRFVGFKTDSKSNDPTTKPQNSLKVWTFEPNTLIIDSNDCVIKAGTYGTVKFPNILKDDLIVKNKTNQNKVRFENRFIWKQDTLDETMPTIKMYLSKNGVLSYKRFEYSTSVPSNLIDGKIGVTTTEKAKTTLIKILNKDLFDYPKPFDLIEYLVKLTGRNNLFILDFFAGSGTTGHAILNLNKMNSMNHTFILCQLNENKEKDSDTPNGIAYNVTYERLKRIMTGECYDGTNDFPWIKDNDPYGGSLDVYEIESIPNDSATEGKTPFELIDETLYGQEKLSTKDKIEWVCENFAATQIHPEDDEEWEERENKMNRE